MFPTSKKENTVHLVKEIDLVHSYFVLLIYNFHRHREQKNRGKLNNIFYLYMLSMDIDIDNN